MFIILILSQFITITFCLNQFSFQSTIIPDELLTLSLLNQTIVNELHKSIEFHDHINEFISQAKQIQPSTLVEDLKQNLNIQKLFNIKHISNNNCLNLNSKLWNCQKGYYCSSPFNSNQCPLGYYCPKDTFQPNLCCQGFYCPTPSEMEVCPSGHYCPIGSIKPTPCSLGICSPGSHTIQKSFNWVILGTGFIIIYLIVQCWKKLEYSKVNLIKSSTQNHSDFKQMKTQSNLKFKFDQLNFKLSNGKSLLKNIVGEIKGNTTCCILGPSGAGKTTLLDVLIGKISPTRGGVSVNGRSLEGKVGFVPQSDIMLDELNVYQILTHEAMLKLPTSWSYERKMDHVIDTIELLQLQDVIDCKVGTTELRGISGGQKKRVNIGMELVGNPDLLILDEPTSGLDTSTGARLCNFLKEMSEHKGISVISVLHAPSTSMFQNFDQLVLMGRGGQVAFMGTSKLALLYFEKLGFTKSSDLSTSEFLLELISGNLNDESNGLSVEQLYIVWNRYYQLVNNLTIDDVDFDIVFVNQLESIPLLVNQWVTSMPEKSDETSHSRLNIVKQINYIWDAIFTRKVNFIQLSIDIYNFVYFNLFIAFFSTNQHLHLKETQKSQLIFRNTEHTIPFWTSFKLCLKRALIQNFLSHNQLFKEQLLHISCGLCLSFVSKNGLYLGPLPDDMCKLVPLPLARMCASPIVDQIAHIGMMAAYGACFCSSMSILGTFGNEHAMFLRERRSGLQPLPYFLAKIFADLPKILITSTSFTLSYITFFPNNSSYAELYGMILSIYLFGTCVGYFISLVTTSTLANLAVVANHILWCLVLGGVEPGLPYVRDNISKHFAYLWSFSGPRWAIGIFYLIETTKRQYLDPNFKGLERSGYLSDSYSQNYQQILIICGIWLILSLITLKYKK